MASGIGIDLLEIERLERALERHPRLAERVFTEAERDYAGDRARPGRHLAARFAAKEAVVKALGLSGGFGLREIEVVAGEPPTVRLARPRRRGGRGRADRGLADPLARFCGRGRHRCDTGSGEWSPGCSPLFDAEGIRAVDRWAIEEQGIPAPS